MSKKKTETHHFQAETKQLLDLMIHSVYSHKEIFLRELISNSADALDKLRFEALTDESLSEWTKDLHIRIEPDKDKRTLTVSDNGIGMDHDEIVEFIGTIARSGTKEYLNLLQKAKQESLPPELIGQFGVGFYSSFMVADKVTLISRKAREEKAWQWESDGAGSYTINEAAREAPGTTVILHLKDSDSEDGLQDFTEEWTLRNTVKKYSDFVAYPVRMKVEREKDDQKIVEDEVLNSMKAIWLRPEDEVKEEDYQEFYKHISHDWNEPLDRIRYKAEGTHEFRSLLFIPEKAPFDLFMREGAMGISLYVKRVFIMRDCKELIPEYLRFIKGVVDSEDLSLNISRELLQQNREIQFIQKALVRKVLEHLKEMLDNDREKYDTFWNEFGRVIREGLVQDFANKEKILDICLFNSTASDEMTTLAAYVERMKEGQDKIYYITGDSLEMLKDSPHLEAFRDKGYEVLLLTDAVDEVWVQSAFEFQEKALQSVGKGVAEIGSEEERKKADEERKEKESEFKPFLEKMKEHLDEYVKEVRFSSRLTSSLACLVGDAGDMTPQMEFLLRSSGQEVPHVKRILELNPNHELVSGLKAAYDADPNDPKVAEFTDLIYGQAVLAEGGQLPNPNKFSKQLAELMVKSVASAPESTE